MTTNELEAQMSTDDRERVVRLSWLVLKTCASRFFGSWGFYDLNDFATVCLHAVQLPVETFNPPTCLHFILCSNQLANSKDCKSFGNAFSMKMHWRHLPQPRRKMDEVGA